MGMKPVDIHKAAFNTTYGHHDYFMQIGLFNSPKTFHTLMNNIFHDYLDEIIVICMDCMLILDKGKESYHRNLELLFPRYKKRALYVPSTNFTFLDGNIGFFGLFIGTDGVHENLENV